jgi:hypothetical protein
MVRFVTGRSNGDQPTPAEGIPDPSDMPPLCDEEEFTEVVAEMVADEAPRLFAIVAEFGDRVDAKCAAWGLAFDGHAYVVGVNGSTYYSVVKPEDVLRRFRVGNRVTPRVVWFDPTLVSPPEPEE